MCLSPSAQHVMTLRKNKEIDNNVNIVRVKLGLSYLIIHPSYSILMSDSIRSKSKQI